MFRVFLESGEDHTLLDGNLRVENERRCCAVLRDELAIRNFLLRWPTPLVFSRSQWRWPLLLFIVYRVIVTAYCTSWMLTSAVLAPVINGFAWPVYMTNWAYFLLVLHLWMSTILVVSHAIDQKHFLCKAPPLHQSMGVSAATYGTYQSQQEAGEGDVGFLMPTDRLTWYNKCSWILFNTAAIASLFVSIVYFAALYPQLYPDGGFPSAPDFNFHAINSIIVLTDVFLSALPVRLLHVVFAMVFGLLYGVFSALIFVCYSSKAIYPKVLDWNHAGSTALLLLLFMFVAIPIVQLIIFLLFRFRVYIFTKIYDVE